MSLTKITANMLAPGAAAGNLEAGDVTAEMLAFDPATQAELEAEAAARAAGDVKLTGDVVQIVNTQTGAVATTTTVMPFDDTVPQITEGGEFMTRSITPTNASNILKIDVVAIFEVSAANYVGHALFQDSTANAQAAALNYAPSSGTPTTVCFTHYMVAGTTSATTFRYRAGLGAAGTFTFNGQTGARKMGGVLASSITITEFKA